MTARRPTHRVAPDRGAAATPSMGAMKPAAGRVPAMDRKVSTPTWASSSGISAAVRWSAQVMARPTGRVLGIQQREAMHVAVEADAVDIARAGRVQRCPHGHDGHRPPALGVLLGPVRLAAPPWGSRACRRPRTVAGLVDDDCLDRLRCRGRCPAARPWRNASRSRGSRFPRTHAARTMPGARGR